MVYTYGQDYNVILCDHGRTARIKCDHGTDRGVSRRSCRRSASL
jgi:hypothetical protein